MTTRRLDRYTLSTQLADDGSGTWKVHVTWGSVEVSHVASLNGYKSEEEAFAAAEEVALTHMKMVMEKLLRAIEEHERST